MAHLVTVTTLPWSSGLPADVTVFQHHWLQPTTGATDRTSVGTAATSKIADWLQASNGFLASYVVPGTGNVDVIDLEDPRPRLPFMTTNLATSAPPTTFNDYPPEVAVVISYEGNPASGANQRRRRGRTYFGPCQFPTGDRPDINTSELTSLFGFFNTHMLSQTGARLAVYSRSNHAGFDVGETWGPDNPDWEAGKPMPEESTLLGFSFTAVNRSWADNAWDTQRRRGRKATTRLTFTVP